MYIDDSALNDLQSSICHKSQLNQTNQSIKNEAVHIFTKIVA